MIYCQVNENPLAVVLAYAQGSINRAAWSKIYGNPFTYWIKLMAQQIPQRDVEALNFYQEQIRNVQGGINYRAKLSTWFAVQRYLLSHYSARGGDPLPMLREMFARFKILHVNFTPQMPCDIYDGKLNTLADALRLSPLGWACRTPATRSCEVEYSRE